MMNDDDSSSSSGSSSGTSSMSHTDNRDVHMDYLESERAGTTRRTTNNDRDESESDASSVTSAGFDFLFQDLSSRGTKFCQRQQQPLQQDPMEKLNESQAIDLGLPPPPNTVAFERSGSLEDVLSSFEPTSPPQRSMSSSSAHMISPGSAHRYSLKPFLKTGATKPQKNIAPRKRFDKKSTKKKSESYSSFIRICIPILLLVLAGLAIALIVQIIMDRTSSVKTLKKTSVELSDYFVERLSPATIDAIKNQRDSPQAHAYQWLQEDIKRHQHDHYSEYRQVLRFALATFFFATNGEDWQDKERWLDYDSHECSWNPDPIKADTVHLAITWPITCFTMDKAEECNWINDDTKDCALLYINLPGNGLAGTLPSEISLLTDLVHMIVADNSIGGSLPTQFGGLTELQTLDVGNNHFTGTVPKEIENLKLLQTLDISQNQLEGDLSLKSENYDHELDLRTQGNNFS